MPEKVCPSCGSRYDDDSDFCRHCGGKLIAFEVKQTETSSQQSKAPNENIVFHQTNENQNQHKIKQIKSSDVKHSPYHPSSAGSTSAHHGHVRNNDKQQTQEFDISEELKRMQPDPEEVPTYRVQRIECPFCGAVIPAGNQICPACKADLSHTPHKSADQYDDFEKNRKPLMIAVSVIACVVLLIIVIMLMISARREPSSSVSGISRPSVSEKTSEETSEFSLEDDSEYEEIFDLSEEESIEESSIFESSEEESEEESSIPESSEEESVEESSIFESSEEESVEEGSIFESSEEESIEESIEESTIPVSSAEESIIDSSVDESDE